MGKNVAEIGTEYVKMEKLFFTNNPFRQFVFTV